MKEDVATVPVQVATDPASTTLLPSDGWDTVTERFPPARQEFVTLCNRSTNPCPQFAAIVGFPRESCAGKQSIVIVPVSEEPVELFVAV